MVRCDAFQDFKHQLSPRAATGTASSPRQQTTVTTDRKPASQSPARIEDDVAVWTDHHLRYSTRRCIVIILSIIIIVIIIMCIIITLQQTRLLGCSSGGRRLSSWCRRSWHACTRRRPACNTFNITKQTEVESNQWMLTLTTIVPPTERQYSLILCM